MSANKDHNNVKRLPRWPMIAIVLLLLAFAAVYNKNYIANLLETQEEEKQDTRTLMRVQNPYNLRMLDSCIKELRTGDLALRTGDDAISHIIRQLNQDDQTYSHCGIVVVEDGYPFVYHSIGGEDNPNQRIKRDSAQWFFSPAYNLGFGAVRYKFKPNRLNSLKRTVLKYYHEERVFDMQFDLATDDKLYCSEMVMKAVNEAIGGQLIKPSTINGRKYVAIDNLYLTEYADMICEVEYK